MKGQDTQGCCQPFSELPESNEAAVATTYCFSLSVTLATLPSQTIAFLSFSLPSHPFSFLLQ